MASFAVAHGAGDLGWAWHLVAAELSGLGHDTVAPDLPCDDADAGLAEYTAAVVRAVGDRPGPYVAIGHSMGGFTAPLVAAELDAAALVFVNGMVPRPGERAADWWAATGFAEAQRTAAEQDGGLTGNSDMYVQYFHDLPPALADEAMTRQRDQTDAVMADPWPMPTWPPVPTYALIGTGDRMFPASFQRRVLDERLALPADRIIGIDGGHCMPLSRPVEIAAALDRIAGEVTP